MTPARTNRRIGPMTAALLAAVLASSLASATLMSRAAGAAVPAGYFGRAFALRLPGNSATVADAYASALSCSSFGNCVVGGSYADTSGNFRPLAVAENSGKWSRGVELKLPNDAPPSVDAEISGVSCSRIGDCTAIGDYPKPNADDGRIFAITETSGAWQQATELKLPSNAAWPPQAQINAVSCWAVGSCSATGSYLDATNNAHAALFTETKGSWHRGTEIGPPSDAGPTPDLGFYGIACQKGGQCVLAGSYLNSAAKWSGYGLVVSHGSYLTVEKISLPHNADGTWVNISSVSCQTLTKCVIVGAYRTTSGQIQPLSAVESNDAFKPATEITTVPPGESDADIYAISCAPAGPCVAAGTYADTADRYHAMIMTRSATGHWGYGVIVVNPPDASPNVAQTDLLTGVSCFTNGCVTAGSYELNGSGGYKPMAAIEP